MDKPVYTVAIKDLPTGERPRERLLSQGPHGLANRELMAILLRIGSRGESALALADRVLAMCGSLRGVLQASVEELGELPGMGPAKAAQLKAALELGRRLAAEGAGGRVTVTGPSDVASLVMEEMRYLDRESFRAVLLDTKHHVIGVQVVSVGNLNSSLVHPRELFKDAIRRSCAAMVLVHNHPSGDPDPSREDIALTRRLAEVGTLVGIEILDHIVIGDNTYVSLKEQGIL